MPGSVLHMGATVVCSHMTGQATPLAPNPRVTVSGQMVVTIAAPYAVAGCLNPPVSGGPCVTGVLTVGATRVLVQGQPVALLSSTGTCAPTGVPLLPLVAQLRVTAI